MTDELKESILERLEKVDKSIPYLPYRFSVDVIPEVSKFLIENDCRLVYIIDKYVAYGLKEVGWKVKDLCLYNVDELWDTIVLLMSYEDDKND